MNSYPWSLTSIVFAGVHGVPIPLKRVGKRGSAEECEEPRIAGFRQAAADHPHPRDASPGLAPRRLHHHGLHHVRLRCHLSSAG